MKYLKEFKIFKFNEFLNEDIYFIFNEPFRIDDLIESKLFDISVISKWSKKYNFDKWAVGIFVSKKQIEDGKDLFDRWGDETTSHKYSDTELLSAEEIEKMEKEEKIKDPDKINLSEISDVDKVKLRISTKGTKNKVRFNTTAQGMKGDIISECEMLYNTEEVYLYIFEKGKNDKNRARQLHGFIYEEKVRTDFDLTKPTKGEKWDAIGSMNVKFIEDRIQQDDVWIVKNGKKTPVNSIQSIKNNFNTNEILNWSVKSSSIDSKTVYFADFKRIAGLEYVNNDLKLVKSNLEKYMLVLGYHKKGNFTEEYIIEIDINKWLSSKYLPDVRNEEILNELNSMYNNLESHRIRKGQEKTTEGEKKWKEYTERYSKLTKGKLITLNFKRDTKGQLRIQASMTEKNFNILLKENNHIVLKRKTL